MNPNVRTTYPEPGEQPIRAARLVEHWAEMLAEIDRLDPRLARAVLHRVAADVAPRLGGVS